MVVAIAFASGVSAQDEKMRCEVDAVSMVGNAELSAQLAAPGMDGRVSGRMSVHLAMSREDMEKGTVRVGGWNLAFFSVPQAPISGTKEVVHAEGLLGFAATSREAMLRFDRDSGVFEGEIKGFVDTSHLSTVVLRREPTGKEGDNEFFETLTQPATLRIKMRVDGEPWTEGADVNKLKASVSGELVVGDLEYAGQAYPAYSVNLSRVDLDFVVVAVRWWEVARKICIQPVRIGRIRVVYNMWGWPSFIVEYTGDGLAFGQPGVTEQWNKADVVFTYRDWKTVWNAGYWVTSDAGTEEENLRAEVDDDDCIETFFVDDFDPVDAHGGGAAWGGGTAGSKVITSDANARNGIDLTHLAHEYGHVIGLHHPWEAGTANLYPASTGTLMCGSGFNNDNPTINSQENKDNLANPLLQFTIKWLTPGPDCQDDTDCGACP
jgi:hypothetical protein